MAAMKVSFRTVSIFMLLAASGTSKLRGLIAPRNQVKAVEFVSDCCSRKACLQN